MALCWHKACQETAYIHHYSLEKNNVVDSKIGTLFIAIVYSDSIKLAWLITSCSVI